MKTEFLANPNLKLILFGGKGGTGKTTCSAAASLYLHKLYPERRILVMSTDPAHSLGDSFDLEIGNKTTPIVENVWGLEIDAMELYKEYMDRNGEVIKEIADRGTIFDRDDIDAFFEQTLPGLDELMAIIKIADLLRGAEYDLIILDTAPTGHTLVLLDLPQQMLEFNEVMKLMMDRYHYIVRALTRRDHRDECDEFIISQKEDVRRVRELLSNARTTEFVPVTIPEPMSIYEIERLVRSLKEGGIAVRSIIVNRVIEGGLSCPFCSARRQERERFMPEIVEKFAPYNLVKMPLFPDEIRGREDLTRYGELLFGVDVSYEAEAKQSHLPQAFPLPQGSLSDLLEKKELDFLIFGGKGGVGKTTVTAASAIRLAEQFSDKRVLIFSTDPAHSLCDSFDMPIGNRITPIPGSSNLYALEIDGYQLLEDWKQNYRDEIEETFEEILGKGVDIPFDRKIIKKLVDVIPLGVEELMSLRKIMDMRRENEYDLYLMDSSPSGHLIRFLQLPHIIRDWLKVVFQVLIKYKGVVKLEKPTERLLDLSRDIRNILKVLSNPQETEFVMITIPEEMGVAEMRDLFSSTAELKVPSSHTVINMIIPPTDCAFCKLKRQNQQKYIKEIVEHLNGQTIIPVSLLPYEVRGLDRLAEFDEIMYGVKNG